MQIIRHIHTLLPTCSYHLTGLYCVVAILLIALHSCSSRKFLKQNEKVLSNVSVVSTQRGFKSTEYKAYVKQQPNAKWFTLFKVPLGIYCLSKSDSIKGNRGVSKLLRKMGEAPVIYAPSLTLYSQQNIEQALYSNGHLHGRCDTIIVNKRHKCSVIYQLTPGPQYYLHQYHQTFDNDSIRLAYEADATKSLLRVGGHLNLNKLSDERSRIVTALHNRGYYYINKDFISFDIDTLRGSTAAIVTMRLQLPIGADSLRAYRVQHYRNINITIANPDNQTDSVYKRTHYHGLNITYQSKPRLSRRLFASHIGLRPDTTYCESQVQDTYANLNALPSTSFTTIHVSPTIGTVDSLDCNIQLHPNKPHSIGLDIEGTNTSGDLGAAATLSYSNRNLFRNAELLTLKLRGAYESITGLEGYNNQNYTEWSAEVNLRFPTLLLPYININTMRRLKANSEAKVMYDTQDRPEFHRRVLTGSWAYNWHATKRQQWQHHFDLLSINYVYMPWISDTFRHDYLEGDNPHYSVLRYSYENLFIVKTGYNFTYNSLHNANSLSTGIYQTYGYQIKFGIELAGNILNGLSKLTHSQRDSEGRYNLFGIAYSQYAKVDFDFAKSTVLNDRNSLSFHAAFGLGLPYGNSTILPYEKRYFAGGANSVRGWSVRGLGPGAYKGKDGKIDFINQTGNLKLDLSVEWRTYLFWKLHGAFFIDAGNVWNTRAYADMDEGQFHFNTFYKQIAVSYGLGLRLNFNYFILRFDGGMKAINPTITHGRKHYPITQPKFDRDFTFHFAVGLPF